MRSVAFNILFYLNILVHLVAGLPFFALPRSMFVFMASGGGAPHLCSPARSAGIRVEFVGLDKIPPGRLLVAAKHQSTLETFTLLRLFEDPTYIAKRELMWIPWFGWYLWKARIVPVDRGARRRLADHDDRVRAELRGPADHHLPGRDAATPGAPPDYKYGAAHLYGETGVPCLPVALNSGLLWGRR